MRLACANGDPLWLGYGMNVHPGGSPEVLEQALEQTVLPLRRRLGAKGPFGVALRLDAPGVAALEGDIGRLKALHQLLAGHELVPFTANGFVLGRFHGPGVKADVYRPSWREAEREDYTLALAAILAHLRGPGHVVSISTAPGSWRGWGEERARVDADCARRLVRAARRLRELEHATGVRVLLGLEPEPGCTLERVSDVVAFFHGALHEAFGRERGARHHIGVCLDVCHQAVMFEDVRQGLDRLKAAGVPIVKVQASAALELPDPNDAAGRAALEAFAEPTWLHQTTTPDEQGMVHLLPDLPEALGAEGPPWRGRRPWRTHFHVPVFRERALPPLRTTQAELDRVLARVAQGGVTRHLEVETYTWEALPAAEREAGAGFDLTEALARELEHVLGVLRRHGARVEAAAGPAPLPTELIVVSDRAAQGVRADRTADLLRPVLAAQGFALAEVVVVPDERERIAAALRTAAARAAVVLTTGGTGVAARDVTPEATRDVLEVEVPGLGEEMRRRSAALTPKALGSRALGGVLGRAVVLNLPGRPEGAVECFGFVAPALAHLAALRRGPVADASHLPGSA